MTLKTILICIGLFVVGYGVFQWQTKGNEKDMAGDSKELNTALVSVKMPKHFSSQATIGKRFFEAKCALCHGQNAAGQKGVAPPLIHKIYEPSHHGDESFQRAVALGVRAHHWSFGNMPPIEGMTRNKMSAVIAYIRELQRANGIK